MSRESMRHDGFVRCGFTLIELLVSIGVIGVLLSLLLPALGTARERATTTLVLSNLRGVGLSFSSYHSEHNEVSPWAQQWQSLRVSPVTGGGKISSDDPWILTSLWPALFHDVAPWHDHYDTWVDPPRNREGRYPWLNAGGGWSPPSFKYSRSFLARPNAWAEGPDIPTDHLLAPTRSFEVLFPSSKCLAFDDDRAYLRGPSESGDPRAVLAADGSAAMRFDVAARSPVQNRVTIEPPILYHDTANGVKGRDF